MRKHPPVLVQGAFSPLAWHSGSICTPRYLDSSCTHCAPRTRTQITRKLAPLPTSACAPSEWSPRRVRSSSSSSMRTHCASSRHARPPSPPSPPALPRPPCARPRPPAQLAGGTRALPCQSGVCTVHAHTRQLRLHVPCHETLEVLQVVLPAPPSRFGSWAMLLPWHSGLCASGDLHCCPFASLPAPFADCPWLTTLSRSRLSKSELPSRGGHRCDSSGGCGCEGRMGCSGARV